jgi:hypothetical protein
LGGTGLVADDLWLLAHHEVTGRPYLHARQLGLGLAGGLLAELMMTGPRQVIQIRRDGLLEIGPQAWRRTVNTHPLLRQMAA